MARSRLHFWIILLLMVSCGVLLHSRSNSPNSIRSSENGVLMNVSLQLSPPAQRGTWRDKTNTLAAVTT
jgi:hypothetical protein